MVKGSKGQRGWKYLNCLLSDFFYIEEKVLDSQLQIEIKIIGLELF